MSDHLRVFRRKDFDCMLFGSLRRLSSRRPPVYICITAVLIAIAVSVVGCSTSQSFDQQADHGHGGSWPLTISMKDNSGKDLKQVIDAEPQRVVVIGQNLAELMIAFGLQDKVVGVGYLDGADSYYRDELAKLPKLSEQVPSAESVMALNPDLILSMSFALTEENFGTADVWNKRGIPVLMADNYTIGRDLTSYFDDIAHIGTAFGVSSKTDRYIATERRSVSAISATAARSTSKPRVLLVASGGSNKLTYNYYSPSLSLVDEMVSTAGGEYIEVANDTYAELSAENIIKAVPDVIVMTQFQEDSAESEKATLLGDTRLRNVPAVAKRKVLLLDYSTAIRGTPHYSELTRTLAAFIHPDLVFS